MEKGPDLPQEFVMGGSVYDIETENWILLGGSDIAGKMQYFWLNILKIVRVLTNVQFSSAFT